MVKSAVLPSALIGQCGVPSAVPLGAVTPQCRISSAVFCSAPKGEHKKMPCQPYRFCINFHYNIYYFTAFTIKYFALFFQKAFSICQTNILSAMLFLFIRVQSL